MIDAIAVDANGQNSIPTSVTAPDITAPDEPTQLVVSADGTVLSGRGEPGSTVRVLDAQGNQIGSAVVNAAGSFAVPLDPPQTAGQTLAVTAQDTAGNVSDSAVVTAPNVEAPVDVTAPDAPTNLVISPGGNQLNGRGEAGSTVNVRDAQGNLIGTGIVAADGSFNVALNPAVIDGSALQVDLTDAAGNVSQPGSVLSPDLTAPAPLTDLVVANGVTLTGTGESGATVQVRDAQGNLIGTGIVGADGSFTLTLSPAQANGEFIDVRQTDAAGNTSVPLAFQAPDITAPAAVTNVVVGADGVTLSGRGEAGATVQVRDANGNLIGTGTVAANGTFVLTLNTPVAAGQAVALTQTDAAGNVSADLDFTVPATPAPASPTGLVLNADGTELSGTATPGNRVEVRAADGTLLGNAVAAADGTFTITLQPAQANGELIDAVAIDANGQSSIPTSLTAPDITAPSVPSVLVVSADGASVTGRGEPGSTVRVLDAQGNQIGSAVVNAAGSFAVPLDPPQTAGQALSVTAEDAAGNVSTPAGTTAPNLEPPVDVTPPQAPLDLALAPNGVRLTGSGEANAQVQVRDGQGNLVATATVGADGRFSLDLAPAVIDGSTLRVTLVDAAGNVSAPTLITSRDLTAPEQPSDLQLIDGDLLSGAGEIGAQVEVRDAAGVLIGSGSVDADGRFSLTLDTPQLNGEPLDVRLIDAAGNSSSPLVFQAPDSTAPDLVGNIVVSADGLLIAGRGEAGATVSVRDTNGQLLAIGVVGVDGNFLLPLTEAILPGSALTFVQTDAAGLTSVPVNYLVPLTPPPLSPSDLVLAADGSSLSGSATPGTTVQVRDANGEILSSVGVGAEGRFEVVLDPPQANGEPLQVVVVNGEGNASLPVPIVAPDITAPDAPSALLVSADGRTVIGRAEAGSQVQVRDAQGNLLGSAQANAAGSFSVTLQPAQVTGQPLQVSATDNAGNTSPAGSVTAPQIDVPVDTTPPAVPTALAISLDGATLSGRGEVGATVRVLNAEGQVLAEGQVALDGQFILDLAPAVIDGSALRVTLTDAAGNSASASLDAPDLTAPAQPTDLLLVDGQTLSGSAEAGARVEVRDAEGTLVGQALVDAQGRFSLSLDTPLLDGEALLIEVIDGAGNRSTPLDYNVPDVTPPGLVLGVVVSVLDGLVAGRGEVGARVEVRDANGTLLGAAVVADNGTFLVALDIAVAAGDALNLVQIDTAGNRSAELSLNVPEAAVLPSPANVVVAADGASVSGTAPAGSQVLVQDVAGTPLGETRADAAGNFQLPLVPPLANGEDFSLVVVDATGNSSLPTPAVAPDITAPSVPSGLQLSADGTTLNGRGEPGANVQVVGADGQPLGNGVVNGNGSFSLVLNPAQVAGQAIDVILTDGAGNVSTPGSLTAPNLLGPLQPSGFAVDATGTLLTGLGQAGSTLTVRDIDGNVLGRATVDAAGRFSLTLTPAQRNGEALDIEASDAAGNLATVNFAVPDIEPPLPVTQLLVSGDGATVSGQGEAGATVTVRGPDGLAIGTALVAADGSFSVPLDTAQTNGQTLTVEQRDVAGNLSTPATVGAPDLETPEPASALQLLPDGSVLIGVGEPGTTVTVRNADGVVGTAIVAEDGSFRVTLQPAQLNGQLLTTTLTDGGGNVSTGVDLQAPDLQAPDIAAGLSLSVDGTLLSGTAEPGATVEVRTLLGVVLGDVLVDADGRFQVVLPAQINGQLLDVVVIDAQGNASVAVRYTANDTSAPLAPENLQISPNGNQLSGTGEVGSRVEVRNGAGVLLGQGVVQPGGLFVVNLAPLQNEGQTLQVTLTDTANNTSIPTDVTAPDTAPLEAPLGSVSVDGSTVSGTAVGAVSITLRDAAGLELITVPVQADGAFTATLPAALTNGELISLIATDGAGLTSVEALLNAPDTTPPEAALNVSVSLDGTSISGNAEPGSTVIVRDADGELGRIQVGNDGTFVVPLLTALLAGDSAELVVVDAAGNENAVPTPVDGPLGTVVETPSQLQLSADGFSLTGVGTAGCQISVVAGGVTLGTGTVGTDGTFLVFLRIAAFGGQTLQVNASLQGVVSAPVSVVAPDVTAPDAPLVTRVERDGTALSGRGEVGATVTVRDSGGALLGSAVVDATGAFSVALNPAPVNGETLLVRQADAAGNLSLAISANAPDITPPAVASGLSLNDAATVVSGQGESGALVTVRDANGLVLATGTVNQVGQFQITLPITQVSGAPLQITLTDRAGNTSEPVALATPDRTPPLAVGQLVLSADGSQLTGTGEPGASVRVRTPEGTLVGSATVADNGLFVVTLTPPQTTGLTLGVTQADAAGNLSPAIALTTPDLQPPASLSNLVLNNDGLTLSGLGQAGNTVEVRNAAGTLIGTGTVAGNGTFVLTLDAAQLDAERLSAVQINAGGIASAAVPVIAPDLTPPAAPSDLLLASGGLQLTGSAEAGSTVQVRDAQGLLLGTALVEANGTFRLTLAAPQVDGQALQVTATDAAGNRSPVANLVAADTTPPDFVSNLALSADGATLTGHGEAGADVTVNVIDTNGTVLGTGVVDADGRFAITLDPPATPGLPLGIVQVDANGNASPALTFDVPAIPAPQTPTQLLLADDGLSLSGVGSVGSTVQVYGPNGLLLGSAAVLADGTFNVVLNSRQANGERLEISAEGVAGTLSLPATLQAPDLIAPQPLTQLSLSADGLVLSGKGEAGATVNVSGSGGLNLGTAQVAADGSFSVTLDAAQLNGERLNATQADAAGNTSDSIALLAPDRTAPEAPAELRLTSGGGVLLGTGEAGAQVSVLDASGALLGSATVLLNGTFEVALTPLQANGQILHVVLTDAAGNRSAATDLTAPDTTAPALLRDVSISADGVTLTGRGEVAAVVRVSNTAGEPLGTAIVDASGNFSLTLTPALTNAEALSLVQADAAGNLSPVLVLNTPDFTPPEPLSAVQISVDGSVVTGRGEPGSTVTVRGVAGQVLGSGLVQADETFRVELDPPQINNQILDVQQADPPGNLSQAVQITAPDRTPPVAPDNLALNGAGNQLSGTGEAGTTVRVSLGGATIGTASVGADGRFVVQLEVAQRNGERLQVTLEDASQNVSLPTPLVALDVTPPAQVVASLNADGTQISGSGEAGARVTVVNDRGNVVAQGVIDADGRFVLDLAAAQQNGQVLSIVAQDATGNPSVPLLLTAQDLTPPAPLLDLSLNAAGTLLTGTGEVGSTVIVRAANGAVLGEVQVPTGGAFGVPITPAQLNGQTLTVSATDAAGNTSDAQTVVALDVTPPALVTNLSINTAYDVLTGRGEAGATVRVTEGATTLGTAVVAANGTFQVTLVPTATPGAALSVTQTDVAGNPSLPADFDTPLEPVPPAPTDVLLSADGLVVTGLATAGSEVRVFDAAGTQLGVAEATLQGTFQITLAQAQLNGQMLEVVASSSGGASQPFVLMAADVTAPAQPVVVSLSGNGLVLSGTGEAGATVTVRSALGATLGTALVSAAGTFVVTLASPQLNGQTLSVQQTDAAGNGSIVLDYGVPDVQAPGAPGNLQLLDGGLRLIGTGEAGALVSVSGRGGVSLGSVQVAANGQFELTLPSAQLDGQVLTVRQADRAGNLSASATLTAADTTAPTAPSVAINAAGTVLTGTGEAGTRVTVRSNGAVVGSATVAANGTYVVTLTTPQANFETLSVTLTDGAGNVSPVSTVVAPDFTPPSLAGNLLVNATGTLLTGSGEVGASVTVRGADGSVLQSGVVIGATGLFSVVLNPAQDNGQALTVSLTDPRGNVSANATVVAPDIDVNLPVVASDNLATAVVNLAPVVVTQAPINDSYTLLVGLNTSKTFTWTVAAGTTANPVLTLSTDNLLGLLNSSTFTLQVKNASGAWVDIATANDSALLTLVLLPGVGLRATIGTLQAGDYQLVTRSGGLGVLTTVNTRLDIETTSLTQFTGTGTALAGNVVSDLGVDGTRDILGPDSGAVLQVFKAGSYVTAGAGTTVQGQYGSLLIRADGSYTYTPNGSTASVGKVDVFSYQLAHPNGKSDTANLYVRIDSPQATEVWNDSNLAAPARLVDAVDDVGRSNVVLANKVTTATQDFARIDLPALAGVKSSVLGHTVAAGTTADLQVVLTSTNLLALLGGASVQLQKLNASGQYVTVQTVNGNDLLSLVNNTARGYTFANQSAGTYQVTVKASGLLGLGSSLSSTLNTSTKSLTEFVVDRSSVATGNLLAGDTLGSNLTTLSVQTAANTYAVPGYNGISVVGLYGILLVQADGSYSYTLKPGLGGSVVGQVDQFTYALTHPNGSVDTAQLKITVAEGAVTGVQRLAALDDNPEATLLMAAVAETDEQSAQAVSDDPRDAATADNGADAAATTDAPLGEDAFAQVEDAAEGTTLLWQGGDASIDLGSLVGQVQDLEVLDLNATSAVSLSISLEDVLALNDGAGSPLLIKGDGADSVLLGEQWSLAGQGVADGIDYDQYTAQQDPSQQLWIQNSVHVV
nr:BapA/Bap/LapF family large adhesin [uncultured Pseudomonas sp.]